VLDKDGEDQLDQLSRRKGISYIQYKEGRLIGLSHLARNCLLKYSIEEKTREGKTMMKV
jgi:hypothetical protein